MESIMLLDHVNFSFNNMTRERIKNSFQEDLHSIFEAGNPPTTLLLGDDLPKKIREGKESSKFTSHPLLNCHDTQDINTRMGAAKGNKHRVLYRPKHQNRQYRN